MQVACSMWSGTSAGRQVRTSHHWRNGPFVLRPRELKLIGEHNLNQSLSVAFRGRWPRGYSLAYWSFAKVKIRLWASAGWIAIISLISISRLAESAQMRAFSQTFDAYLWQARWIKSPWICEMRMALSSSWPLSRMNWTMQFWDWTLIVSLCDLQSAVIQTYPVLIWRKGNGVMMNCLHKWAGIFIWKHLCNTRLP